MLDLHVANGTTHIKCDGTGYELTRDAANGIVAIYDALRDNVNITVARTFWGKLQDWMVKTEPEELGGKNEDTRS